MTNEEKNKELEKELEKKMKWWDIANKITLAFMLFCNVGFVVWFFVHIIQIRNDLQPLLYFVVFAGFVYGECAYFEQLVTGGYFRGHSKGFKEGADMAVDMFNKVLDDEFKRNKEPEKP